ncbi:MAG: hypothetical protein OXU36_10555 [Candidatus Poribacteria bacterium]|nr:hypothetical protein [Candidatus Poribacteria bacterium]
MLERLRDGIASWFETQERAEQVQSGSDQMARAAMGMSTSEMVVSAQLSATRMAALTMTRGNIELDGVTAEHWGMALNRDFLFQAISNVLRKGNSVYYLESEGEMGYIRQVSTYEVRGEKPPYNYHINIPSPENDIEKTVMAAEIMHLRIGINESSPWEGRGVFSDMILPGLDMGLKMESRFPIQRFMPFPVDKMANVNINDQEKGTRTRAKQEVRTIANSSGIYQMPNTSNRGTQKIEITSERFNPSASTVQLREDLISEVWESIGYPPALRGETVPGQAARQLFSQWVDTFLQPIADILADQMTLALESEVKWDLSPARVPTITDQASAWRSLTREGKISPQEAGRIVGLDIMGITDPTETD